MEGEINMKKVLMNGGGRTLSRRLFSIMLIIGILFSAMPDATYADNSGRPPDAIEQEDTEDTESEMSDNKAAEPEQDTEVDEIAEDEIVSPDVQVEEDESNHDNEVMATEDTPELYAILYDTGELHFQYGNTVDSTKGSVVGQYQVASAYSAPYQIPWLSRRSSIVKVTSDTVSCSTGGITSTAFWFYYCPSLTSLDLSKFDTSNVKSMSFMFDGCPSLTSLNLSKFDTSKVTDMGGMFTYCSSLTSLNLSSFDTSKVTNINNMFSYCSSLTSLNLSSFDTSKVMNMTDMFYNCTKLTSLIIGPSTKLTSDTKLLSQDWIQKSVSKKVTTDDIYAFTASVHTKETFEKFVSYSISYNLNGGSVSGNPSSYTQLDTFTLPTPTKNGYTFTGWTGSNGTTAQKNVTIAKGSTGNRSYTANWTQTNYSISYSLNGGSLNGQKTIYNIETASFTLPTPTRSGYTFTGWTGTGLSSATKSVTVSKGSTGNRSYTANWSANGYTVSFNYNKPSTAAGTMSGNGTTSKGVTYAAAYGTLPQPSMPGWTFDGWYTAASGGSRISATTTYTAAGNQTLYAHWTLNTYSISYNVNGGSLSGQKTSYNVNTDSFTLPTPTKNGYTFTGWTGSNGTTAQKSVTITKSSTGNKTYTAHFEKTVTATFKYYNNQTVTVTGKIIDSATSVAVKAPAASGTPSGYTFRGWSTSSAANASVNAAASANVTISANVTYYASYSKNVTATFYYCTLTADNYTYTNGAQKSATASATQYLGYAGAVVNSNIAIPSAVTASHGGASAQNYVGVSKDTNSASTVTPTTAYTKYYAVYTEPLKFYYYNGTNDTSTSVARRMLSNGSTYSNSLSASAPAPAAYDGAAFAWWSCDSGASNSSSLRKPLETGVNSLYAVYKKNVSISYNANGGSGAPAAQSGIKYYAKKESGSNIANPSITVTGSKPSRSGYSFSSWNTSANGSGTVYKAGTAYTVSVNVTLYAQWTVNTYTDSIQHWITGYKKQEGINSDKTASILKTTTFQSQYKSAFILDSAKAINIPNGCCLRTKFGTFDIEGTWNRYSMGTKVTQKADNMIFEYDYDPVSYSITYNLNGGINNGANPSTYDVLYGVSLKAPTKTGYTFTGWYDENGNKITGINEGCNVTFSSADDLYAKLASRTTGNRILTAKWTPNALTVKYHNDGGTLWAPNGTQINVTNKDVLDTEVLEYDLTRNSYNLYNASHLTKKGYHANGYWFVGSKNSSIKISDSKYFLKAQDLAQDAGVLDAFQKGNVTIDLYPDMSPNTYTLTFDYGKKTVTTTKSKTITYDSVYGTLPNPQCTGWTFKGWNTKADGSGNVITEKTMCKDLSNVTVYAQWSYNSASVKVPQVLTGNHTGKSQFRVKCDNFKAGSIKVTVPDSFPYKQTGKADVIATITSKSGNNTITPSNKVCVYNITTTNGLSAGCWQGSFNIGLTLTKE